MPVQLARGRRSRRRRWPPARTRSPRTPSGADFELWDNTKFADVRGVRRRDDRQRRSRRRHQRTGRGVRRRSGDRVLLRELRGRDRERSRTYSRSHRQPWLVRRRDPYDDSLNNPYHRWKMSFEPWLRRRQARRSSSAMARWRASRSSSAVSPRGDRQGPSRRHQGFGRWSPATQLQQGPRYAEQLGVKFTRPSVRTVSRPARRPVPRQRCQRDHHGRRPPAPTRARPRRERRRRRRPVGALLRSRSVRAGHADRCAAGSRRPRSLDSIAPAHRSLRGERRSFSPVRAAAARHRSVAARRRLGDGRKGARTVKRPLLGFRSARGQLPGSLRRHRRTRHHRRLGFPGDARANARRRRAVPAVQIVLRAARFDQGRRRPSGQRAARCNQQLAADRSRRPPRAVVVCFGAEAGALSCRALRRLPRPAPADARGPGPPMGAGARPVPRLWLGRRGRHGPRGG